MGSIQDNEQALKTLAQYGIDNASTIGGLPNAAGLTGQADNLSNIADAPINFAPEQQYENQLDSSAQNMFALGQTLGVQKATAAMLQDKASRTGGSEGDQANAAANAVSQVGQTGAAEEGELIKSGLSQQAASAVARLNTHANMLTQTGLQQQAELTKHASLQDIALAQSGGVQQVTQAGKTAQFNEAQLEQQYESQQWSFWTRLATGLLSAGAAVGGVLLAPATGGTSLLGTAAATGGVANAIDSGGGSQAQLNAYNAPTQSNMTLNEPGSLGTTSGSSTDVQNTAYTPVNDGLPIS